jgi:hypothetical protein
MQAIIISAFIVLAIAAARFAVAEILQDLQQFHQKRTRYFGAGPKICSSGAFHRIDTVKKCRIRHCAISNSKEK